MENSYHYFENRDCEYFPCHRGIEELNCLFCYCPFYGSENCPGAPRYIERAGQKIKDCTDCTFPHKPEHYDRIMGLLKEML